jgi:hypothetical protein
MIDVASFLALVFSNEAEVLSTLQYVPQIVVLAVLSTAIATAAAIAFRWYAADSIPEGIAILLGLSGIALVLNTTTVLADAIGAQTSPVVSLAAPEDERFLRNTLVTTVAFALGVIGADLGRRTGDRIGTQLSTSVPLRGRLDADVSELIRTRGRLLRVTLPTEIADIDGYDPVSDETKTVLAGTTLVFPRRLTKDALRTRLTDRLTSDYQVSAVDVELDADGSVTYLGVGSRVAGIGATIPPGQVAVALRADPPSRASPGDVVEVWERGSTPKRVADAELRAIAGDVVTLVVDETTAETLDSESEYRLVTMPAESNLDREFATVLRAADETMSAITIEPGSVLAGVPVGALGVTVVAVRGKSGVDALPAPDRLLDEEAVIYAIGTTSALRAVDAAARDVAPTAGTVLARAPSAHLPSEVEDSPQVPQEQPR